MRSNYEILKSEASALASKVEDITYLWPKNTADNYGLLGDILSADEYGELTGIDSYVIPNEQFYLEQMYNSNHFKKSEMLEWEKKPSVTKTDYIAVKHYFEGLVKATDTYAQNLGGYHRTQQV